MPLASVTTATFTSVFVFLDAVPFERQPARIDNPEIKMRLVVTIRLFKISAPSK